MIAQKIYITISQASVLAPILYGGKYYSLLSKQFKVLFAFFLITIFFEIQANIAIVLFHNNMPGLHLYTVVEMFTYSFVYYRHWSSKKILSFVISANTALFVIMALADAFFINGVFSPNTNSRTFASISLTIYALIYYYDLFKAEPYLYSWQYPMFWFSTGVMVYFGLNTFYFMLANYLYSAHTIGNISSYIHAALNILSNCLIAQAFRCHKNFILKS